MFPKTYSLRVSRGLQFFLFLPKETHSWLFWLIINFTLLLMKWRSLTKSSSRFLTLHNCLVLAEIIERCLTKRLLVIQNWFQTKLTDPWLASHFNTHKETVTVQLWTEPMVYLQLLIADFANSKILTYSLMDSSDQLIAIGFYYFLENRKCLIISCFFDPFHPSGSCLAPCLLEVMRSLPSNPRLTYWPARLVASGWTASSFAVLSHTA